MNAHRAPEPSNLQLLIDAFADRMGAVLPDAAYHRGVAGGHEWAWATPSGRWSVQLGGLIHPGPVLAGPDGCIWRTSAYSLRHADLFIAMLQLAGAIPGMDRPGGEGSNRGLLSAPGGFARGQVYAGRTALDQPEGDPGRGMSG